MTAHARALGSCAALCVGSLAACARPAPRRADAPPASQPAALSAPGPLAARVLDLSRFRTPGAPPAPLGDATDDDRALARALAALGDGGGTIDVPPGEYELHRSVALRGSPRAPLRLRGSGPASVLRFRVPDAAIVVHDTSDVTVEHLAVTGAASRMIVIDAAARVRVVGCDVSGGTALAALHEAAGIWASGVRDLRIEDNRLTGNGNAEGHFGADILFSGSMHDHPTSLGVLVRGNACTSVTAAAGIYLANTVGAEVLGNLVTGARTAGEALGYGILVSRATPDATSSDNVVVGNVVAHTEGSGVYARASTRARVAGNVVFDVATRQSERWLVVAAIALDGGEGHTVTGNFVSGSGHAGIGFTSTGTTVVGNRVEGALGAGIALRAACTGSVVRDNVVTRSARGVATFAGASPEDVEVRDNLDE